MSSDLAAAKKSLKEKMTAEETVQQQYAEELKSAQERAANFEKELSIMKHTAKFMEIGYAPDLAKQAAEALFGGDTAKLFELQQKFNEEQQQKFKSEMEKKQFPGGSGGNGTETDPAVAFAKSRGQAKTETAKAANDALKYYI